MTNWEPTEDGRIRCLRHEAIEPWRPREPSCTLCPGDPGPELVDEIDAATPAPAGCLDSEAHERKVTGLAELAEDLARKLCDGIRADGKKGRINYSTAFKGLEIALKLYASAQGLTTTRERRDRVARLERRQRDMHRRHSGRGGSN